MLRAAIDVSADILVASYRDNEYDIAGLAEIAESDDLVQLSLRDLYRILDKALDPSRDDPRRLANVLLGMVTVAREDYAAHGHHEYWDFLFERIKDATFADPERFWNPEYVGQSQRHRLGEWFLTALEEFGYSIPVEGHTYVTPIVFHAGIPRTSLTGVLRVISNACTQYGRQTESLPPDLRRGIVESHSGPLHRNAKRLLSDNLQGAAQLWRSLARVANAWQLRGECADELGQLPVAIDADAVRSALPERTESAHRSRVQLPQLRFDAETGEVRLFVPQGRPSDWSVTDGRNPVEVRWQSTHLGSSAAFEGPLPADVYVKPGRALDAVERVFCSRSPGWPGYWFHAKNGNLEDATTIESSGLLAGTWYVLFEGTPSRFSIEPVAKVPLMWSWFKGQHSWTAWEVKVPPRTPAQTHLEWYVDDNCFRVPLARRPGPMVTALDRPMVTATTPDGDDVEVFDLPPTIRLERDRPLAVLLLRETTDEVQIIERIDLAVNASTRISAAQLRDALEHRSHQPRQQTTPGVRGAARLDAALGRADSAPGDAAVQLDRVVVRAGRASEMATAQPPLGHVKNSPVLCRYAGHTPPTQHPTTAFHHGPPWTKVSKAPATPGKHHRLGHLNVQKSNLVNTFGERS